jgi:uncharacterized protein YndB with AHSA1/START domain
MATQINVTRVFDASVADVWALWTEPELIRGWWGPDQFTCPLATLDFREGGTGLVCMKAADNIPGMGGQEFYTRWNYHRIIPFEYLEFIQNLVDAAGDPIDPATVGMPADFPRDIRTVVRFRAAGPNQTEMTVTEHAEFGSISVFAQMGLEQSVDKMVDLRRISDLLRPT